MLMKTIDIIINGKLRLLAYWYNWGEVLWALEVWTLKEKKQHFLHEWHAY